MPTLNDPFIMKKSGKKIATLKNFKNMSLSSLNFQRKGGSDFQEYFKALNISTKDTSRAKLCQELTKSNDFNYYGISRIIDIRITSVDCTIFVFLFLLVSLIYLVVCCRTRSLVIFNSTVLGFSLTLVIHYRRRSFYSFNPFLRLRRRLD